MRLPALPALAISLLVIVSAARSDTPREIDRALLEAVRLDNVARVQELLDQGADPKTRDERENPLLWLADRNRRRTFLLLLEHGADINASGRSGLTLLHGAAPKGPVEWMRFLLDHGADVNRRDHGGNTPLMHAARLGFPENVKLLIARGSDVNARNSRGETPLSVAREILRFTESRSASFLKRRAEVLTLLRKSGAGE